MSGAGSRGVGRGRAGDHACSISLAMGAMRGVISSTVARLDAGFSGGRGGGRIPESKARARPSAGGTGSEMGLSVRWQGELGMLTAGDDFAAAAALGFDLADAVR